MTPQFYAPELIRKLLQCIAIITFGAVLTDSLFALDIQRYLALTPYAIDRLYLWQFATSLFLIPAPIFSFSFLIDVGFVLLLLWMLGTLLYERIGKKAFITTYILSGIVGGLGALFVMNMQGTFVPVSTCYFAILAITTLWTMADPYQQLIFLFVLPIKAKWLLIIALAGTLLGNFFQGDLVLAGGYLIAFLFSYFYGLFILGFRSPFDWMLGFDKLCKNIGFTLRSFWQWRLIGTLRAIQTRRKAKEEAHIDRILDKVAREGQNSLSVFERLRLKWYSFKKKSR